MSIMHSRYFSVLIVSGAFSLLAACDGGVGESLGIERQAPDEFSVISRPPLSLPPEFNLRPPAEGDDTVIGNLAPANKQAEALVRGENVSIYNVPGDAEEGSAVTLTKPTTEGEAVFLQKAGIAQSNPGIREVIRTERPRSLSQAKEAGWSDYFWWNDENEQVVVAKEEAERIKKNTEEGNPITEGETPMEKGRDTGFFGRVFGY